MARQQKPPARKLLLSPEQEEVLYHAVTLYQVHLAGWLVEVTRMEIGKRPPAELMDCWNRRIDACASLANELQDMLKERQIDRAFAECSK